MNGFKPPFFLLSGQVNKEIDKKFVEKTDRVH